MILIIDNYDSFTYNLLQYIGEISGSAEEIKVIRNDKISCSEVIALKPCHIIISPGPCTPNESGISLEIIKELYTKIPILGVCLGHQAIAQAFGGTIIKAPVPVHGKISEIYHQGENIFKGLKNPFSATRYHSLIAEESSLPPCLKISARTKDNLIMGLYHRDFPYLTGVQFHPESIMTEEGKKLLLNFLKNYWAIEST